MEAVEIWPVFGLRILTPRLELRSMTPELAVAVANLAAEGIHDPAEMPFLVPWTDVKPPDLQRETLRFYWTNFAGFRPEAWNLPFAVFEHDELVGVQSSQTEQFPILRSFETGSWVGRAHQGRGIGKEMRAAILHFMFDALEATVATTGAFVDNHPSLGVTRSLGYEPNGTARSVRRGTVGEQLRFRMTRDQWRPTRRDDITIEGFTASCLAFLGLSEPPS